jgi:2-dehydropantoate 2-reductase
MRTLFIGAGATGGFFGGRLAQAGRDVTFLVRPKRAAALAEHGLRIRTPDDQVARIDVRTVTADALDGRYDLIVLGVKSFALESALADLAPAVGPDTVIVPLLNGMRHLDVLTKEFAGHVFGGLCMVAGTLEPDGTIHQLNTAFQRLCYGPLDGPDDRLDAVAGALSGGGFDSDTSADIIADMWAKWVFLAPLGAITCLLRGTIGDVNAVPGGPEFALGIAAETMAIATAAGYPPSEKAAAALRANVTQHAPATSSMYRDLVQGLPVEAEQIIGDLVARGRELGVAVPLLSLVNTHLAVYQHTR